MTKAVNKCSEATKETIPRSIIMALLKGITYLSKGISISYKALRPPAQRIRREHPKNRE